MARPDTLPARRGDAWMAWLLLAPALLGLALFDLLPLIAALIDSLRRFNPFTLRASGWNFPHNYVAAFGDPFFRISIGNTLLYVLVTLILTLPAALALALPVHRRLPMSGWLRNVAVAAFAFSETVTASIWDQMFEPATGLLNAALVAMHLPEQRFLSSPHQAMLCIIVMSVWKSVGLPMLILLAGLQAVPRETEEAAALEGAGPWIILTRITLPQLRLPMALAGFVTVLGASRILTPIVVLTQGGPDWSTTNLSYYIYAQNFAFSSPGTASVGMVGMFALLTGIALLQIRAMSPRGKAR